MHGDFGGPLGYAPGLCLPSAIDELAPRRKGESSLDKRMTVQ